MPDSVKSLWYIKFYILSSTNGLEHSSNSIGNNCQKISSRMGIEEKSSENKVTNYIWKTEFSDVTYGLYTLLTNKQPKNDLLNKR